MKTVTDDLMLALKNEKTSVENFLKKNEDKLVKFNVREMWDEFIKKSNMSKTQIIERSSCGYNYFYCIINGEKTPSRDKIIELILAMNLSVEDCQKALKYCGKAALYPRIKRDSIIIYGIKEHQPVNILNTHLKNNGERTLKGNGERTLKGNGEKNG